MRLEHHLVGGYGALYKFTYYYIIINIRVPFYDTGQIWIRVSSEAFLASKLLRRTYTTNKFGFN